MSGYRDVSRSRYRLHVVDMVFELFRIFTNFIKLNNLAELAPPGPQTSASRYPDNSISSDIEGSMYIGNIHWKHCRLETSFAFGNKKCILETCIGYWKQKLDIGNIKRRLET